MKMIRAFVAIDLPEDVKNALGEVSRQLANQVPTGSVRWVKPERMHLTVRFLGDTAVSQLPQISSTLDDMAKQHPPFSLHLSHLGCFPNERRPRVIWVGLQGNTNALLSLKQDVDQALAPLGWEVEKRPFRAHLTLGRVKDARKLADVKWGVDVEKLVVPVTAVKLIESQLRPLGPLYIIRHESKLLDSNYGDS
jgi:2'-5' RNA ligase